MTTNNYFKGKRSLKACISPIDENNELSAISLAKSFDGLEEWI